MKSRGRGLADGPLPVRLARGARAGLVIPGIFALVIAYYYLKDGRHPETDTDMLALLLFYALGSTALMAIVAACTPIVLRSWWDAILVGCLATLPLVIGVAAATSAGLTHWDLAHTILSTIAIVTLGPFVGAGVRRALLRRASVIGSQRSD